MHAHDQHHGHHGGGHRLHGHHYSFRVQVILNTPDRFNTDYFRISYRTSWENFFDRVTPPSISLSPPFCNLPRLNAALSLNANPKSIEFKLISINQSTLQGEQTNAQYVGEDGALSRLCAWSNWLYEGSNRRSCLRYRCSYSRRGPLFLSSVRLAEMGVGEGLGRIPNFYSCNRGQPLRNETGLQPGLQQPTPHVWICSCICNRM